MEGWIGCRPFRADNRRAPSAARRVNARSGFLAMKLPAHNRYDYIPICRRVKYEWPGGARLAVTFNNNIEHFAFGVGLGSDSTGAAAPQSQRNYAWRDYGN